MTSAFAERWNGSVWSIVPVPFFGSMTSSTLSGIWCDSAVDCVAVGSQRNVDGQQAPLVYSWDGTAWSVGATPPIPVGAIGAEFSSVSCVSSDVGPGCYAAGDSVASSGRRSSLLEQNWFDLSSVDQWRSTSIVDVAAQSSLLLGVRCSGDDVNVACAAVGYAIKSAGVSEPITVNASTAPQLYGDGLTLSAHVAPMAQGATTGVLSDVDCASASSCTAVGSSQFSGVYSRPLISHWNGAIWSVQSPPAINNTLLFGLTCDAICTAVGDKSTTSGTAPYVIGTHGWRAQSDVSPIGDASGLNGVSCVDTTHCSAVGFVNGKPFAERWVGGQWTSATLPSLAYPATLTHVSCRGASFCMAVGYASQLTDVDRYIDYPVGFRWDGTSWHATSLPHITGDVSVEFTGVSCASASFCVAVGWQNHGLAPPELSRYTLIDVWNGTSWTVASRVADHGSLVSVSCYSTLFCEAVGNGDKGWDTATFPISYKLTGGNWAYQAPDMAEGAFFAAVSCPAVNNCVGVGGSWFSPMYAEFNGNTWTDSYPELSGDLASVSCISAVVCEAVSESGYAFYGTRVNAFATSVTWTPELMPQGGGLLADISCSATTTCDAVGSAAGTTYVARRS